MNTREALRRMRNLKSGVIENYDSKPANESKKDLSMRDMLAITRNQKKVNQNKSESINEADMTRIDLDQDGEKESALINTDIDSRKTAFDQRKEEDKFRGAIQNFNVDVQFEPIKILDNSVVWNGTIDNQIQWSFLVTPDESVNGVQFNYAKDFDDKKPDNEELIKKVEAYYDDFYKYWRDNELNN